MVPDSYIVEMLDEGVGALSGSDPAESGSKKVDVTRFVETLPEDPFCEICRGLEVLAASSLAAAPSFELGLRG
jgi:hypothetical protein